MVYVTGRPERYPDAPSGVVLMSFGPVGEAVADGVNIVPWAPVAAQPSAATATDDEADPPEPDEPQPAITSGTAKTAAAADFRRGRGPVMDASRRSTMLVNVAPP
ncbi:hypothetical protein GCM10009551_094520 [Nocardiopsis tropica]|nr:hypothetical protein TTY48_01700 [Tsukamurella sp. TY48]